MRLKSQKHKGYPDPSKTGRDASSATINRKTKISIAPKEGEMGILDDADARRIAAAIRESNVKDAFSTLVRAVVEDSLEPTSPKLEMGKEFGSFPWGDGFDPSAVTNFPWLVPFFYETEGNALVFKKHAPRGPMSNRAPLKDHDFSDPKSGGWKPWGDVMVREKVIPGLNGRKRKIALGPRWFTRTEIAEEFPWLVPDPRSEKGEGDAYFLRGLGVQKRQAERNPARENGEKRSGYIDFYESLLLFLNDLLARKVIKFADVVELFKTFSLEDFKNLKRNKRWRLFTDQFSNRRQVGEGGKTEIHMKFSDWAWKTPMIRDSLLFLLQDELSGEKPAATEATHGWRLDFIEIKDLTSKINLVWMWSYPPNESFWMRLVALLRIAAIRCNILDDFSGEEPWEDRDTDDHTIGPVDKYGEVPWPLKNGTVTPTWWLSAQILFERNEAGVRVLRTRQVSQAFVNGLWDKYRLWLWGKADRPAERAILGKMEEGLFALTHRDVIELRDKKVWRDERESNLLLAILLPGEQRVTRKFVDAAILPSMLAEPRWLRILGADASKRIQSPQELVRALRAKLSAVNVEVIPGWSETPYEGLARMMQLADDTWDVLAFLKTEPADERGEKGLDHAGVGVVAAYREPACWHPYNPQGCPNHQWTVNSTIKGNMICDGWKFDGWTDLSGERHDQFVIDGVHYPVMSPAHWFLFCRFKWILRKVHLVWRGPKADERKYKGRARELAFTDDKQAIPESRAEILDDIAEIAGKQMPIDMMSRKLSMKAKLWPTFKGDTWPSADQREALAKFDVWFEYQWSLLVQRTLANMVTVFNVRFRKDGKTWTYDEILDILNLAAVEVDAEVMLGVRTTDPSPDR